MDKIKIITLEIKLYFSSIFQKITEGGFVNQLIKNVGLTLQAEYTDRRGTGSLPAADDKLMISPFLRATMSPNTILVI